jgi:hypothetical protein
MPGSTTKRRSVMGLTTKKKEVVVIVEPPRPEFKWMSKADVIAAKKKDREIAEKTRIYHEGLRSGIEAPEVETPKAEPKVEAPVVEKKKAGRPKKLE